MESAETLRNAECNYRVQAKSASAREEGKILQCRQRLIQRGDRGRSSAQSTMGKFNRATRLTSTLVLNLYPGHLSSQTTGEYVCVYRGQDRPSEN